MKMAARKSVTNRQEEVDLFDLRLDTILFPVGTSSLNILNHHYLLSTVCPSFC
jgi:hypothetical protein